MSELLIRVFIFRVKGLLRGGFHRGKPKKNTVTNLRRRMRPVSGKRITATALVRETATERKAKSTDIRFYVSSIMKRELARNRFSFHLLPSYLN
jgi:hypothetical protein